MKLLLSTLFLSFATLLSANNDPCNCNASLAAAKAVTKAGPYNLSCAAYVDYQITHLQFYIDVTQKLLSSGHQTGIMNEQLSKVASAAQAGIGKLMKEKGRLMALKINGAKEYKAQLERIHAIGAQEFKRTSGAMYVIIKGGKRFTATSDGPPMDSGCSNQRTDMRQACLNALQAMQDCGFYDSLGATKLQDDQEKCTDKANAIMALCVSENNAGRSFSSYYDQMDEMTKAMNNCRQHRETNGAGNPAQTQTSSGR